MNGCIYRTKDNECDLYAEGGKYQAFCEMSGCEGRRMSNADKIRAMTDEELAEWLSMQAPSFIRFTVRDAWRKWLGEEADK